MAGFVAHIDESGCDGFDFEGGSSEFLVLGAMVTRADNTSQFQDLAADIRAAASKPDDWQFKTFKKLKSTHSQRWCIADHLARAKCQVAAVAIHKPSLTEEGWQEGDDLYFQAAKFLLERISWACRDAHKALPASDPRVEIVFSKKGCLRYDELADYMRVLRSDPAKYGTNADWKHLDPGLVRDEPHDDNNACHQAADHFAAALGCAFECKDHGLFDDRFIRLWTRKFYKPKWPPFRRVVGNGLKIWPDGGYAALRNDRRGEWMKMSFAWK